MTRTQRVKRWLRGMFDSAETTVANALSWGLSRYQNVNAAMQSDLLTMRQRCAVAARNNPLIAGVVYRHVTDVFGARGPILRMQTGDKARDARYEQAWRDWCECPDISGKRSLSAMLRTLHTQKWVAGEFFLQIVTTDDGLKINNIAPDRIASTTALAGDNVLGIKTDEFGKPLTYYVVKSNALGWSTTTPTPIDAKYVIHGYEIEEEGQLRGIPLLQSALPVIENIRRGDNAILLALEVAAKTGVLIQTKHQDATFFPITTASSYAMESGAITNIPPGWEAQQISPTHPSANYLEFRREMIRQLGKPRGIPLLAILDAAQHNYSSARYEGAEYARAIATERAWYEDVLLNRLLREVLDLARFDQADASRGPLAYSWVWPRLAHVDPEKEAAANDIELANGTATMADVLASKGIDYEAHVAQLTSEMADFAGLPVGPWASIARPKQQGASDAKNN